MNHTVTRSGLILWTRADLRAWADRGLVALAVFLLLATRPAAAMDFGLGTTLAATTALLQPRVTTKDPLRRPHAIWSAVRFTVNEYPLIPFAQLRQMGVGTLYPHLGRLELVRVKGTGQGTGRALRRRVQFVDYKGNVIFPDNVRELYRMVQRCHREGFRVVPWFSIKREKAAGTFWLDDDWTPLVQTVGFMVDRLGIDGIQLDPEPLPVVDVPALNLGLARIKRVLKGRELGVSVPKLVRGTKWTGYAWPDLKPFQALDQADVLCLMTYDTGLSNTRDYQRLLVDNLRVAKALAGRTRVYMGLPSYPYYPSPGVDPRKVKNVSHPVPPEDGPTFVKALLGHPDLKYLAGVAIYDLEEPEDLKWNALWQDTRRAMNRLNRSWPRTAPRGNSLAAE